MANEDPKTGGTNPDPPETNDDPEASFWAKFDEKLNAGIGAAIDKKLKEFRETSNSRTGRTTVPGFFADFMFGKDKK